MIRTGHQPHLYLSVRRFRQQKKMRLRIIQTNSLIPQGSLTFSMECSTAGQIDKIRERHFKKQLKQKYFFIFYMASYFSLSNKKWLVSLVMGLLDLKSRLKPLSQSSSCACKLPKSPFLEATLREWQLWRKQEALWPPLEYSKSSFNFGVLSFSKSYRGVKHRMTEYVFP